MSSEFDPKQVLQDSEDSASAAEKREYEAPRLNALGAVNKIVKAGAGGGGVDGPYS